MKKLIAAIALLAGLAPAAAQQTLPANTVVGRLGVSAGPSQAIPFDTLTSHLGIRSNCNKRPSSETSYAIGTLSSDNGGCVVVTNTTAIETLTLPSPSGGQFQVTVMVQSGQSAVAPAFARVASSGGKINGLSGPIDIAPYQTAVIWSDGTDWNLITSNTSPQFGGAGLFGNYSMSYSPMTLPPSIALTLTGACAAAAGQIVGFDYTGVGFSPNPIQFRHTMTASGTCLADAANDLAAQYAANTQIQNAYGKDAVSYSIAAQTGTATWTIYPISTYPFSTTGSPTIAGVSGANVSVNSPSVQTATEVGAFFAFVRSTAALGRTMAAGDFIGNIYWCADSTVKNCDPREVLPMYGQMGAMIIDPTLQTAQLDILFNKVGFVNQGAAGSTFGGIGIGTLTPNSTMDINLNTSSNLAPAVGGGATTLKAVAADGLPALMELRSYTGGNVGTTAYSGVTAKGTGASPLAVTTAEYMLQLIGRGYDGTNFSGIGAAIYMQPAGTWSGTDHRAFMDFCTTPGSSTTLTCAMRVQASGGVTVGPGSLATDPGIGSLLAKTALQAGISGTQTGSIYVNGGTSGQAQITVPAVAGTPVLTLGSGTGTPAVTASAPLAIATATGNITCANCISNVVIQKFIASGTYTPTSGIKYAIVECVGGGGGGGGVAGTAGDSFSAAGGGSGAYSRARLTAAQIGASQTVTVGALGAGGTAGANNGTAGGDTSLGTLCVAKGGNGGGFSSNTQGGLGGAGGAGTSGTGDITGSGAPGGAGLFAVIITVSQASGSGGSSIFGGGAPGVSSASTAAGSAATNYGSGGSGAQAYNTASTAAGGNGSAGIVIVTEFIN